MSVATRPSKTAAAVDAAYTEAFERVAQDAAPEHLAAARREAAAHFLASGFPTVRDEEWRQTNVAPIARSSFDFESSVSEVDRSLIEPLLYPGCHNVVLVNGVVSSALSDPLEGTQVSDLRSALEGAGEASRAVERLAQLAKHGEHAFVSLNTALFQGRARVHFERGQVSSTPVHLIYVSVPTASGDLITANMPRTLIVAEENSQGTVIESYTGSGRYLSCGVTEYFGEAASVVRHFKMQRESLDAWHIASMNVHLERAANFSSYSLSFGGSLVRNDVNAVLDGEGVDCTLNGLYLAGGSQLVDNHMWVEHAEPNCDSHELYKGVLDGKARAVFNGRIYVHKKAQKTDAKQTNRNLLLSQDALVHSNPQLEIFADDVKCTHGSTIGQLEPDALFYLRSRGLPVDAAQSLLVFAFASELVERIDCEPVQRDVEQVLFERLPGGESVREAASLELIEP